MMSDSESEAMSVSESEASYDTSVPDTLKSIRGGQNMSDKELQLIYVESTRPVPPDPNPNPIPILGFGLFFYLGKVQIILSDPNPEIGIGLGLGSGVCPKRGQSGPTQMHDDVA